MDEEHWYSLSKDESHGPAWRVVQDLDASDGERYRRLCSDYLFLYNGTVNGAQIATAVGPLATAVNGNASIIGTR